jgi:hypothetical protein
MKIKTIHVCHCVLLTVSQNAMRKSAPRAECVFEHTLIPKGRSVPTRDKPILDIIT